LSWSSAQHLGQFAASRATEEIHLPQSIGSGGVALSEIEILVVLRFDVGNTAFVTPDRDSIRDAF
jgi:hypothetical protein